MDATATYELQSRAFEKYIEDSNTDRVAASEELQRRLALQPLLRKNKKFAREWAIDKLGISKEAVDQYLEDHYDPRTEDYTMITDPFREKLIVAKNGANAIQEMRPGLPDDAAMAASMSQPYFLKLLTDDIAELDAAIKAAPSAEKYRLLETRRKLIVAREGMIHNPNYIRMTYIAEQIESPEFQDLPAPMQQKQYERWKLAYEAVNGPRPDEDPRKLYLAEQQAVATLAHTIASTKSIIDKMGAKPIIAFKDELLTARDRTFGSKKANLDYQASVRQHQETVYGKVIGLMGKGEAAVMKSLTDVEKDTLTKDRDFIWHKKLTDDVRKELGRLSLVETVKIIQMAEGAELTDLKFSPTQARVMIQEYRLEQSKK